jgi:hypothetical protein
VIVCMDAPPNRGSFNSAHIFGTHVPGGGAVHSIKSSHSITWSASARSVCGNVKAARHADRAVEGELASGCA